MNAEIQQQGKTVNLVRPERDFLTWQRSSFQVIFHNMTGTLSTEANGGSLSKASDTDHVTSAHLVSLEIREARRSLSEISSVKMSFLSHFGLEGLFIIFIMLVVSSACAYIVLQYSSPNFMNAGRPWLWIYVLLFVLYVATACLYLGRWKSYAQAFGERIIAPKPRKCDNNIILQVSVSGPLFLWKLYIMEFIEGLVQLYNMLSLYLCSLPVWASVTISVLLGLDSAFRAYLVEQKFTPKLRNRQLQNDLFFDALVIALPSMLLHWRYQVIIPLDVLIQICAYPLFCIWLKLRSILREMIRNRTNSGLGFQRTMVARSIKRRRESVFGQDLALKLAEEQQQRVPYAVRATLKWYNVLYSVVFIGTGTIHLLLHADLRCNADIWEKCIVKVPFCNSIFSPTCNCAVLKVLDHNWTRLPREINEMRALQKIIVNRGPLASLENVGSAFPRLTELNLAHNRLLNFKMGMVANKVLKLQEENKQLKMQVSEMHRSIMGPRSSNRGASGGQREGAVPPKTKFNLVAQNVLGDSNEFGFTVSLNYLQIPLSIMPENAATKKGKKHRQQESVKAIRDMAMELKDSRTADAILVLDGFRVAVVWSDGSVGSNSKKYAKTFLNTIFATFNGRGGGSDDLAQGQFVQLVSEKMIENALFEMEASKNFAFKKRG